MNFKTKTLVAAAIAAMAMSGAANARILDASLGNSELVFSAWDAAAGVGYTYDLGWTSGLNDVLGGADVATASAPNAVMSASLLSASNWVLPGFETFLSQVSAANVQWNLVAADVAGRARLLVTQGDTAATMQDINNDVKAAATGFNGYLGQVNSKGTNVGADTTVDGYAITLAADGVAYPGASSFGNTIAGKLYDTSSLLGAQANLFMMYQNSTLTSAGLSNSGFKSLLSSDGNQVFAKTYLDGNGAYNFQIAAVPEADTWAMLLAGLGLMGFIARRRTQG